MNTNKNFNFDEIEKELKTSRSYSKEENGSESFQKKDETDENANEKINENRNERIDERMNKNGNERFNENHGAGSDETYGIVTTSVEPIEITETQSQIVGYISSNKRENVRLSSYVLIPYENEKMFGRMKRLRYCQEFSVDDATEIHARRMLNSHSKGREKTNEEDYKLLSDIEPICILYKKGKDGPLQRRMTDRIPKPNTPIYPVVEKEEIQTGLNIPKDGIFLGHLSVGGERIQTKSSPSTVAYYLRNDYAMGDPLVFRHMLVCGSTGTGKTFLTKNILRQFETEKSRYRQRSDHKIQNKPCLVIMDPQDEYSQLFENGKLSEEEKFKFESEEIAYGGIQTTKTFVAKISGEQYAGKSRAEIIEFSIPFNIVKNNPWLLESSEMNENQKVALDLLIKDFFDDCYRRNKPETYSEFKEFAEDPMQKNHYTVETGKIHEATYDSLIRRVINRVHERVFDQSAKSVKDLYDEIFKPGQVSVFPTEYVSDPRIRDLIVLTMMNIIVNNKLNTSGKEEIKNTPIILVLDEAHRYLSNAAGARSKKIVSKFAEAAKQGRKEGLGLFLITQDPQDIETEILKQINTKIVLNLNNDAAINAVKIPIEYEKRVPYLKKGQMIIHSPDNGDIVEIIGLSDCVVKHE
ncbi:MAG: DUF853 family protein [Methanimicrococcus sp.]|nr:DUF853 family protein [Methanimicrococcus sp.]